MQLSNQEKIRQCIQSAREYFDKTKPSIVVEYNFDEPVEEEWFEGFDFRENEKCERNSAKYIYKMG
jgi:hypothetical protein